MALYKVWCVWSVMGAVEVEAESEDEARDIVEDGETPLPDDPSFLEDSFEIDSVELVGK
jgi:hypothetical protein